MRRNGPEVNSKQAVVTEIIKGQKFSIFLNDDGEFHTQYANDTVKGDSLRTLRNKLRTIISGTMALNIPFTSEGRGWFNNDDLQHGVIVGFHDGNRNLLVRYDGRIKLEQCSSNRSDFMRRFTTAEIAEFKRLDKAIDSAEQAKAKFLKERALKDPEFLRISAR